MGFETGLSGLNANSLYLDAIGNNVSNSNAVGYKQSSTSFSDVYANSLEGAAGVQVGLGTQVADVQQQFSQGSISATSNPLDLAINGNGFFRLATIGGAVSYTRDGQFHQSKDGYIVNALGQRLQGYPATQITNTANGVTTTATSIDTSLPQSLTLPTSTIGAVATQSATLEANLNAGSTAPTTTIFSPTDATSYNNVTAVNAYDSLGNAHSVALYFSKSSTVTNGWDIHYTLDGTTNTVSPTSSALVFNSAGKLPSTSTLPVTLTLSNGATASQTLTINTSGVTQFGGQPFGVTSITEDGNAAGQLSSYSVSKDGLIQGSYSNGQMRTLGQVALASFRGTEGLAAIGNNQWVETGESGQPTLGVPTSGSLGALQSSSVEDSNVDLTKELVNMIVAQRAYQANAQTIKTEDQILNTLVNLQ